MENANSPRFPPSSGNYHGIPDLAGLANFVVDSAMLASTWTIRSDFVEAGPCTSIEHGVTPGTHRVLRSSMSTPNIGDADACPVRDEQNFCRVLRESSDTGNMATLRISIPAS